MGVLLSYQVTFAFFCFRNVEYDVYPNIGIGFRLWNLDKQVRPLKEGGDFLFPFKMWCEHKYNCKHFLSLNKFTFTSTRSILHPSIVVQVTQHECLRRNQNIITLFECRDMVNTHKRSEKKTLLKKYYTTTHFKCTL